MISPMIIMIDEDKILDKLAEVMGEVPLLESFVSNRVLSEAMGLSRDAILEAMYEQRSGNPEPWNAIADMSKDDWRLWWMNWEAKARVQSRTAKSHHK